MQKHTLSILCRPAEDVRNCWVAHCLDVDVVTQGNDPAHALAMVCEAAIIYFGYAIAHGRDPFERQAPDEYWQAFDKALEHGTPIEPQRGATEAQTLAGFIVLSISHDRKTARPAPHLFVAAAGA